MINRNILIGGDLTVLEEMFKALGIAARDQEKDGNLDFLDAKRHGVNIFPIEGDFALFTDIWLWNLQDDRDGEKKLFDTLETFGKRGLLTAISDEQSEYPSDMLVFTTEGLEYGYLVEHDEDEGGEFAGHQYISIYPPWKLPEHAKGRIPPPKIG